MIISIILLIIIISLVTYILKMKSEIKSICNQIDDSQGEYINIHTKAIDSSMEELVSKINSLYDRAQKINLKNKNIEEELRRSISNMPHDLRTPLTSIMGYMQLIKSDECSEDEKKEFMDIVERRTKNLQNLISSFYDLSRLHNNEYKFNLKMINLKKILCENLAIYYNDFVTKDIEPVIEIQENISDIISDESAVNRIISNLIGNMLKHGEEYIKITLREEENSIVSEFVNRAPLLDEKGVQKIFDRFYTADNSRTDRNTGLGLSITKEFVEQLGNKIEGRLIDDNLIIEIRWNKIQSNL